MATPLLKEITNRRLIMAKNEKKTITVNDVEHNIEDLTEQQIAMVNHIADLDKKLGSLGFNMDQLNVGREAFVNMLAASLAKAENVEDAIEVDG
jgi:hypothetical protein